MARNRQTQRWTRGDEITPERLNSERPERAGVTNIEAGPGVMIEESPNGEVVISIDPVAITAAEIASRFAVKSEEADYVWCRKLDAEGDEGDNFISVLKPYHLRQTPWDGETKTFAGGQSISWGYLDVRNRTATDTGDSSTNAEDMTPDYVLGDDGDASQTGEIILAINIPTEHTDSAGDRIEWIEFGRTPGWATEA